MMAMNKQTVETAAPTSVRKMATLIQCRQIDSTEKIPLPPKGRELRWVKVKMPDARVAIKGRKDAAKHALRR